jgi:hypothetical protein
VAQTLGWQRGLFFFFFFGGPDGWRAWDDGVLRIDGARRATTTLLRGRWLRVED